MKLPLRIDKTNGIPFYIQIEEQIRLLIHRGVVQPGDPMPTVRELAVDLGINYNTVGRIYHDLQRAGVLRLQRGVGTFIANNSGNQPVVKAEFAKIEKHVRELIALCKKTGVGPVELYQLTERLWDSPPVDAES